MQRVSNGTALLGGSPFRLVRLSAAGAQMLDRWLAGDTAELSPNATALLERLLNAGMVHPVVQASATSPTVSFVVPVHDDAAGLRALLDALRVEFASSRVIVVDDASGDPDAIQQVAAEHGAQLVRHPTNRGPGAARNTAWRELLAEADEPASQVICFLDADVVPEPGALGHVLAHFLDSRVGVVAPRVRARAGKRLIDSYEAIGSPLDMGERPALVRPGSWPSYVPSAALAVRTSALVEADGFDETMRFGEDVDLIWRLTEQDHRIRYEPSAIVRHRNRSSVADLMRQRFAYGSSAATLAEHHGKIVTPLRMRAPMLAAWLAALLAGRLGLMAGLAGAAVSTASLAKKLDGKVERPQAEAVKLAARAQAGAGAAMLNAATRNYAPLLLLHRRTRRALVGGAIISPVVAWLRARPAHGLLTHVVLKTLDDSSYCAGVWAGAWRSRSARALLPDVYRIVPTPGKEKP